MGFYSNISNIHRELEGLLNIKSRFDDDVWSIIPGNKYNFIICTNSKSNHCECHVCISADGLKKLYENVKFKNCQVFVRTYSSIIVRDSLANTVKIYNDGVL